MSSENSTLVKLNNAGFKQNDKWLVEGVSLTVEKGKIVTLIGPNGSGKSTTAKIALGIYKNIEGIEQDTAYDLVLTQRTGAQIWTMFPFFNTFSKIRYNLLPRHFQSVCGGLNQSRRSYF